MAARARLTRASLATTASPSSPSSSRASSEVPGKATNGDASGKGLIGGKKKAKKADDRCPKCAKQSRSSKAQDASKDTWIGCDCCSTWYHWPCVAQNTLDPVDIVDKWYCAPCMGADPSLKPTYREPPRKSSRTTAKINYANLNMHLGHDPDRFITLAESKVDIVDAFGGTPAEEPTAVDVEDESDEDERPRKKRATAKGKGKAAGPPGFKGFRTFKGHELTREWLYTDETAMTEPVIVEYEDGKALEGLDMGMPPTSTTISNVAEQVGPETRVEVIDVASQSELSRWTLGEWARYYEDPKRDKVRNVISLEVSETDLGAKVRIPRIVREMDWVDTIWPEELKVEGSGTYPKVQKYCLMSVARCWTDWHVDFAGSSVFYHILRGSKTFYFIRPTPENIRKYERWSGSAEMQDNVWLGDEVDYVYKVQLQAGHTMIIPTGWIHCVYTPSDSLVFGGNFLHSLNIATQLRIHTVENNTKVSKKFRFPLFLPMLWYVARHYHDKLVASQSTTPPRPLPLDVPPRILRGLAALAAFLLKQVRVLDKSSGAGAEARKNAKEAVPWHDIPDPKALAKDLRRMVRVAQGKPPKRKGDETGEESNDEDEGLDDYDGKQRKKPPVVVEDTKPRTFAPALVAPNGTPKRDEGSIIRREVIPAKTETTHEKRSRPLEVKPADAAGGLQMEEYVEEDVEVRTTKSENTVVRKSVDEHGRTVYETRTVRTFIEKVYYPPAAASAP